MGLRSRERLEEKGGLSDLAEQKLEGFQREDCDVVPGDVEGTLDRFPQRHGRPPAVPVPGRDRLGIPGGGHAEECPVVDTLSGKRTLGSCVRSYWRSLTC